MDLGTRRESLGTERGPGTGWPCPTVPLMFSPSGPVALHPPHPSQICSLCQLRGRGHTSSLGRARVLEALGRCRLDWVSRGYIYIYKGCREPWGQPLPEGATLWGPANNVLHSCPEAGSPFIALGRLAKGAEEGVLERVEEEEPRKPSLLTCCQSCSSL